MPSFSRSLEKALHQAKQKIELRRGAMGGHGVKVKQSETPEPCVDCPPEPPDVADSQDAPRPPRAPSAPRAARAPRAPATPAIPGLPSAPGKPGAAGMPGGMGGMGGMPPPMARAPRPAEQLRDVAAHLSEMHRARLQRMATGERE